MTIAPWLCGEPVTNPQGQTAKEYFPRSACKRDKTNQREDRRDNDPVVSFRRFAKPSAAARWTAAQHEVLH